MADVSGGWLWGRPRLGWMDGVKMALGSRGMMGEAARQCLKDKELEPWCICRWLSLTWLFLHGPAFVWTSSCSGGSSPGEGWDALHDVVGVYCKTGATTENQGDSAWYIG